MAPITPYTADLNNREPLSAMRDSAARIRAIVGGWRPDQFDRSYAPGKWDARQILTHLAQSEIALGYRARMALTTLGYASQSFDQDRWMSIEAGGSGGPAGPGRLSGHDALDAFLGIAAMNIALFASLSDADRATSLSHPEYGSLTVDWIIHQMAGHQIHHLKQLETIAGKQAGAGRAGRPGQTGQGGTGGIGPAEKRKGGRVSLPALPAESGGSDRTHPTKPR